MTNIIKNLLNQKVTAILELAESVDMTQLSRFLFEQQCDVKLVIYPTRNNTYCVIDASYLGMADANLHFPQYEEFQANEYSGKEDLTPYIISYNPYNHNRLFMKDLDSARKIAERIMNYHNLIEEWR